MGFAIAGRTMSGRAVGNATGVSSRDGAAMVSTAGLTSGNTSGVIVTWMTSSSVALASAAATSAGFSIAAIGVPAG